MRWIALASLAVVVGCGGPLEEGEVGADFEPLLHEVDVIVDGGVVRMTVRRALRTGLARELSMPIPLPSGASVDAFRVAVDGKWYDGDLLDAVHAERRFLTLAGLDGDRLVTDTFLPPALLSWVEEGELTLEAQPIPPNVLLEMEYRITAPTCHQDGRAVFDYPNDPFTPALFGAGVVREPHQDETWDEACDDESTLLVEENRLIVELEPLATGTFDARWATHHVGDQTVGRFVLDLPAQLEEIPVRPTVVFLMDGSISHPDPNLQSQIGWAQAYLEWVPDAVVQVVVFHRFAEPVFDGFVPAARFADALAGHEYDAQNGSNLDAALALTAELVSGTPGPVRVIATSDLLMRADFDADAAAQLLAPTGAIVHVVDHEPDFDSDAVAALSESIPDELDVIAHATGGLTADLGGDPTRHDAVDVVEHLVRPTCLHLDDEALGLATELDRGTTFRYWQVEDDPIDAPYAVRAVLWSRPVRIDVARTGEDALPALIIGSSTWYQFAEDAVRDLAMSAGVVSPYTSYLAESGGAPPVEALGHVGGLAGHGFSSFGTSCGCGGAYGVGIGSLSVARDWLADAVREAGAACGVTDPTVEIEKTITEIVDVRGADECVVEYLWAVRLPAWFASHPDRTYVF